MQSWWEVGVKIAGESYEEVGEGREKGVEDDEGAPGSSAVRYGGGYQDDDESE